MSLLEAGSGSGPLEIRIRIVSLLEAWSGSGPFEKQDPPNPDFRAYNLTPNIWRNLRIADASLILFGFNFKIDLFSMGKTYLPFIF